MLNRLLNVLYWTASAIGGLLVILGLIGIALGGNGLVSLPIIAGVLIWLLALLARMAVRYIVFGKATASN